MTDKYLSAVNTGFTKTVAKKLGLPRPAVLRRYRPGGPLVPGPVLVIGEPGSAKDTNAVAQALLGWDLDVRQNAGDGETRWGRSWSS